ncbi:MAG TPA: tetratricopeptide repeat protein [Polyangiales bacterium]
MANLENNPQAPARDTAGSRLAAKRAAKAAQKAADRGTQNPAEEVAKSVLWASSWLDRNAKLIWGGIAALAVAAAGWTLYSMHREQTDREAGSLLRSAVVAATGVVTSEDTPPAEDSLVPTFSSSAERDKKALERYRDVAKKFSDTQAGLWAKLGEASELLALGKPSEAAQSYNAALQSVGTDTFLRARALEGLAYALEAENKPDEALKRWDELGGLDKGAYKSISDFQRARVLAATGKRDEALKLLEASIKASAAATEKTAGEGERFASVNDATQILVQELGGKAAEKPPLDLSSLGGGGNPIVSQQIMDALRKQLAAKKPGATGPAGK